MVLFVLPCKLGESIGGILGITVTLATLAAIPLAFGISVTALLEWKRRSPRSRR